MRITLCGSTRFKEDFEHWNKELTLSSHIVLTVGCFGHKDDDPRIWQYKGMLDIIHKQKIDMSDAIFIINDTHIGESTTSEIEYAKMMGKKVFYPKDAEKLLFPPEKEVKS